GRARRGDDDGRAGKADARADQVPAVWAYALHRPQPDERCGDVDTAIGGIGPPCRAGIDQGQKPGEGSERYHARNEPERAAVKTQPRPERKTAGDLRQSRE